MRSRRRTFFRAASVFLLLWVVAAVLSLLRWSTCLYICNHGICPPCPGDDIPTPILVREEIDLGIP